MERFTVNDEGTYISWIEEEIEFLRWKHSGEKGSEEKINMGSEGYGRNQQCRNRR